MLDPRRHDYQYKKMVIAVLDNVDIGDDRTGTGTVSQVGYQARYDLNGRYDDNGNVIVDSFPLLTTKKLSFKNILSELLWLLNGQTNIQFLEQHKNHIWIDWPLKHYNRESDSNRGDVSMTREEFASNIASDDKFAKEWGNLGPVYGKQWREWETPRVDGFEGTPVDQIQQNREDLKLTPSSRRIITSAWNPPDIEEMAVTGLPPCHTMFQLLAKKNKDGQFVLNLIMYQRSLDVLLGAPYNIASYAMLLMLFAEDAGMLPGTFIHMVADCHVYANHIEAIEEQIMRQPFDAPSLTIKKGTLERLMDLPINYEGLDYDLCASDFILENYQSHDAIKAKVAV